MSNICASNLTGCRNDFAAGILYDGDRFASIGVSGRPSIAVKNYSCGCYVNILSHDLYFLGIEKLF